MHKIGAKGSNVVSATLKKGLGASKKEVIDLTDFVLLSGNSFFTN